MIHILNSDTTRVYHLEKVIMWCKKAIFHNLLNLKRCGITNLVTNNLVYKKKLMLKYIKKRKYYSNKMRIAIHQMLSSLVRTHRTIPSKGLYPPRINMCPDQTTEELIKELRKFINYLEHPHYSYLVKPK